jgi:uncharacterized protein YacL
MIVVFFLIFGFFINKVTKTFKAIEHWIMQRSAVEINSTALHNPMFNGFKSLRNFINKEAKNQEKYYYSILKDFNINGYPFLHNYYIDGLIGIVVFFLIFGFFINKVTKTFKAIESNVQWL